MITDLPNKIFTTILFDLTIYFMTNLRRTPGHFFVFLLFTFVCTLTMSMFFRSIAATSRSLSQAMAPAAIFILGLVIYTGFAIPTKQMHPWFRWINYLDPVGYAFEALMVNEVRIFYSSVHDPRLAKKVCSFMVARLVALNIYQAHWVKTCRNYSNMAT